MDSVAPTGGRLLKATLIIGIAAASIVVIAGTASAQLPPGLPPVDQTEEEVEDTVEETVDEVEETVDETVDSTTGTVDDPVSTTNETAEETSETVTGAAGSGSVAPGSGAQGGSSTGPSGSGKGDGDRDSGSGRTEVAVLIPASSREMMAAQPAGPAPAAEAPPSRQEGGSPKARGPDFDVIPQGGQVILLVAASLLALLGLGALGYRFYPRSADGPRLFPFNP